MTEDWERQVAENAQRYQELQARVSALSVTETSGDGNVVVTVSASGQLTGLVLREPWEPTPLAEIADQVMRVVRRAQSRIPGLLEQAVQDTVGERDPSAHLILSDARARFPSVAAPVEQSVEPARKPARAVVRPVVEEEWDSKPILRDV